MASGQSTIHGNAGTAAGPQARWSWPQFVIPAVLLLGLTIRHGPTFYLLSLVYFLAGAVSLSGLVIQACTGRLQKQRSLGRVLIVLIALSVFAMVHLSLEATRRFIDATAAGLSIECRNERRCPSTLPGWTPRSDYFAAQQVHDAWLRWPVMYRVEPDGSEYTFWLYKGPDMREATIGVGTPLSTSKAAASR
jgi:hypothetical protein